MASHSKGPRRAPPPSRPKESRDELRSPQRPAAAVVLHETGHLHSHTPSKATALTYSASPEKHRLVQATLSTAQVIRSQVSLLLLFHKLTHLLEASRVSNCRAPPSTPSVFLTADVVVCSTQQQLLPPCKNHSAGACQRSLHPGLPEEQQGHLACSLHSVFFTIRGPARTDDSGRTSAQLTSDTSRPRPPSPFAPR